MDRNGNQYNYDLSVIIAGIIRAEPLRCWRNAALALSLLPDFFNVGSYVEGWIVVPRGNNVAIIEHGWSTIPDGIIDPSIVLTEKQSQQIFYFPGYVLLREQLFRHLSGSTLPLVRHSHYGDDGMMHNGYLGAYNNAWQKARILAQEKQLPQTAIKVSGRDPRLGVTIIHGV